jgi:hypothetical protein
MIEKYSCYEFEIISGTFIGESSSEKGFIYHIFSDGCLPYDDGLIESDEWFDSEEDAKLSVINHIDFLENGGNHV